MKSPTEISSVFIMTHLQKSVKAEII